MPTPSLHQLLEERTVLVADGAMGTSLFALGLTSGGCPELLNIEQPQLIEQVHQGFVDAGSDIILTNTFGGNARRLALHDLEDRVAELNQAAVAIARKVADEADRPVLVAGSIGPTGDLFEPLGPLTEADGRAVFAEQVAALSAAGVDVLWIETLSSQEELSAAFAAASGFGLPIVTTMSFDTHGKTMMGYSPADLANWASTQADPPAAVGANCGIGPGDVVAAVHEATGTNPDLVVVAKANCGVPLYSEGQLEYPTNAEELADYVELALRSGARIIGSCCGSTPSHLAVIRREVDRFVSARRPTLDELRERLEISAPPERTGFRPRRRSRART